MKTGIEQKQFFRRWAPTVMSFATLFLGNEETAFDATIDALAEYINSSRTLDLDQMPIRLWDCVVARMVRESSAISIGIRSGFNNAVMKLDQAERLVFLLQNVFAVRVPEITLITKWSKESITSLGVVRHCPDADLFGPPRRGGRINSSSFDSLRTIDRIGNLRWSRLPTSPTPTYYQLMKERKPHDPILLGRGYGFSLPPPA